MEIVFNRVWLNLSTFLSDLGFYAVVRVLRMPTIAQVLEKTSDRKLRPWLECNSRGMPKRQTKCLKGIGNSGSLGIRKRIGLRQLREGVSY